jgi:hypothetical protein
MTKTERLILVLSFIIFIATGCIKQAPTTLLNAPTPIQPPLSGKAVVIGKVISTISNQPLKTSVWLAEVHGEGDNGVYVLNATSSPGIYADENGIFAFMNIEPLKYVIVVGEPEGQNEVITDGSGKPKVWNITANQILDVGELKVALTK